MKFYKDIDYNEVILECLKLDIFQIDDYLEYHFNNSSNKNHNWVTGLNKNLIPFQNKKVNSTKENLSCISAWSRKKMQSLVKNTFDSTNKLTINPNILKNAKDELLKKDFYYSPTFKDFKEQFTIACYEFSKAQKLRYLRTQKEVYQNSRKYYFNYERYEGTQPFYYKLHDEICGFIDKQINELQGMSDESAPVDNGIELDLSESKASEKLIYLKELGVIDFLKKTPPFNTSNNALATVLSAITGVQLGTLQSYLNPMLSKGTVQKNNPYSSKKNVVKVKDKLIQAGFQIK